MPLTTEQKNCEECIGCVRVSAPIVITKPGCYYVTKNITTAAGPVITIRANDVSLDVKGHTLDQSAHSAPVILIEPGSTGIAVFNGTLTGGKPAVSLQSTGPKSRYMASAVACSVKSAPRVETSAWIGASALMPCTRAVARASTQSSRVSGALIAAAIRRPPPRRRRR